MIRTLLHLCLAVLLLPLPWPCAVAARPPLRADRAAGHAAADTPSCPCCHRSKPVDRQPDREPVERPDPAPATCHCLFCSPGFLPTGEPPAASGWVESPTGYVVDDGHGRARSGFRPTLDRPPRPHV